MRSNWYETSNRDLRSLPQRRRLAGLVFSLALATGLGPLEAGTPPTTPGWGAQPPFLHAVSYWNPQANGIQDGEESGIDRGGTWMVPSGPPTPQLSAVMIKTPVSRRSECGLPITGERWQFTLNGLDFKCFVPSSILDGAAAEKVWVLSMPATTNGTMHDQQSNPQDLPAFRDFATCTHDHEQAGRPLNVAVYGYWALGRYLSNLPPSLVEKVALVGGSFGSYSALTTAVLAAGDGQLKLAGVYGGVAAGILPYLDLRSLVTSTDQMLESRFPNGPWSADQELLRTFQGHTATDALEKIDPLSYIGQLRVPIALVLGEEDFSSGDLPDLVERVRTESQAAGNSALFKIYGVETGGHTADGPIVPYFVGDGNDWYGGTPPEDFDLCRDVNLFVQNEVFGKPLPVTQAIDVTLPQPAYSLAITAELSPDLAAGPSGPQPNLLSFSRRLGYGSQLGARDTLFALDSAEAGGTDLVFGNGEGEVLRLTVAADGSLSEGWLTPVGFHPQTAVIVGDSLFVAAEDGRAQLLDLVTGAAQVVQPSGHVGLFPDLARLGIAYEGDQPRELIFLTTRSGPDGAVSEILGLDPTTLAIVFRDATLGTFNDWRFFEHGGETHAWVGLLRGHGVRVKLSLPNCVEPKGITTYMDDTPETLVVVGETVLLSGAKGLQWFDGGGQPLPGPGGSSDYFLTGISPPSPAIVKALPGTSLLYWFDRGNTAGALGGKVGLTDVAALGSATVPPPPLAVGDVNLNLTALAHHQGRLFGTSPNGTILRITATANGLQANPLNIPTGAISWGLEPGSDDLVLADDLQSTGISLVEVDFGPSTETVSLLDSGYTVFKGFQWGRLHPIDGGFISGIGSSVADVGGMTTLFTTRTHGTGTDPTGGDLVAFQKFLQGTFVGPLGNVVFDLVGDGGTELRYPDIGSLFGPNPPVSYGKHTTEMTGSFNLGHETLVEPLEGDRFALYYGGSKGIVRREIDALTAAEIPGTVTQTRDLGWRAVGLHRGVFAGEEVLFAGTWVSHAAVGGTAAATTGHTFVLNATSLVTIRRLDTGLASWGIRQVDLDGDGSAETIVGSATRLQVFDANLQPLFQSAPLTAFHGAYGLILPLAGESLCDREVQLTQSCVPDRLAVGTSGGLVLYDINPAP